MSNQDKPLPNESGEQAPQEATPQVAKPQAAKPQAAPPRASEPKPPRRRGFFSSLFSHLMVALIAVIAVTTYMHWVDILKYTGSRVCAPNMLGQYSSQPAKVPAASLNKPAPEQTKEKTSEKSTQQKTPAEEKPQADTSPSSNDSSTEQKFKQARDEARKLFWKKSELAIPAYEKLVAEYQDNAGLRVEIGNVYFKSDKKPLAVQAYLEAGKRFLQQKNAVKADEMIKILQKLAPEKAGELVAEKAQTGQ